jgi:PAS domain S-box-containing protein
MFCIAGMDGLFKRVNPAFTRILGWSAEELHARPFLDFIHPEDRGRGEETLDALKRGISGQGLTVRVSHKAGGWKWLHWTAVPVTETGLIYASARDVTQQRQAEAQLVLAEQRLRTVINSGPLVLAVLDADGRFVVSEGKGLRGLGLTPGQVVGQSALAMYANEPSVQECLRRDSGARASPASSSTGTARGWSRW